MRIKPFEKTDYDELYRFMEPLWKETYGKILPEKQIDFLLGHYFSADAVKEFLGKGYRYFRLEEDGKLCGVTVICDGSDGSIYLDKLYLAEDCRGKGYAAEVFSYLLDSGKDITLNVNQKNAGAIKCYTKNGFTVEREEEIVLEDGMINKDYVMRLKAENFKGNEKE